jgi:predicted TIM-barrel fold metal-dependent hydrolase
MIDIHTHPVMIRETLEGDPELLRAVRAVFGFHFPPQPLAVFLREMRAAGIEQAVLLPIDCTTRHQCCIFTNEQIADLCEHVPQFIGFASVDPHLRHAGKSLERAIRQLGLRGLKLDPALQGFDIDDKDVAYPIYQQCTELGAPLLIHCGLSWAPSGRASHAHPIMLEAVAQEFPDLQLIVAHCGWPWVAEAVMLALKYRNIHLDTAILYSGTPSDAYRHVLAQQVGCEVLERSLREQVLFGSNYPRVDMRRSVRGIHELNLSPAFLNNLFSNNARRVLRI